MKCCYRPWLKTATGGKSGQKRQVAEQYADLETMAQEARKRKLDESAEVKQMMAIQADSYLANALAKRISDDTHFTELDLRSYYDSHKSEFEEAQGGHILIRFKGSSVPLKPNEKDLTPEEALAKAQEIRKQILAGGDFATLTKAESDDTGTGAKGGDLGTFKHGQMVAPFDQAALVGGGSTERAREDKFRLSPYQDHVAYLPDLRPGESTNRKRSEAENGERIPGTDQEHTAVTLSDAYFGPGAQRARASNAQPRASNNSIRGWGSGAGCAQLGPPKYTAGPRANSGGHYARLGRYCIRSAQLRKRDRSRRCCQMKRQKSPNPILSAGTSPVGFHAPAQIGASPGAKSISPGGAPQEAQHQWSWLRAFL